VRNFELPKQSRDSAKQAVVHVHGYDIGRRGTPEHRNTRHVRRRFFIISMKCLSKHLIQKRYRNVAHIAFRHMPCVWEQMNYLQYSLTHAAVTCTVSLDDPVKFSPPQPIFWRTADCCTTVASWCFTSCPNYIADGWTCDRYCQTCLWWSIALHIYASHLRINWFRKNGFENAAWW
jgi:hypothetical protein